VIRRAFIVILAVGLMVPGWIATRGSPPGPAGESERPPASPLDAKTEVPGRAIDRLGWLAGCWERAGAGRLTQEQWMEPSGGSMLGMSRTVAEGKTVAYEFVRIEEREGELYYIAAPSGQTEATFRQLELDDDGVVFANPDHDFPQRIRYRRNPDGSLLAQIEGERGGKTRVVDFSMQAARCGPRSSR